MNDGAINSSKRQAPSLGSVRNRTGGRGFTLIEVLVVIAVIAILASLLLTALSAAKSNAQAIICLNNSKQLIVAWALYAAEYNEVFANNHGDDEIRITRNSWINNLLTWGASS